MEFLEQIEKVQKKPKSSRIKILIASVGIIMFLIIMIWIQTVGLTSSLSSSEIETKEIVEPLGLLWDVARDGFVNLKNQLKNIKTQ